MATLCLKFFYWGRIQKNDITLEMERIEPNDDYLTFKLASWNLT
jgi:hypothetical protein